MPRKGWHSLSKRIDEGREAFSKKNLKSQLKNVLMNLMTHSLSLGLIFVFSLSLISCNATKGSGNKVSENREVEDFTEISLDCAVDVTVEVGKEKSVSVWADDNLISMITTSVSGGKLTIDVEGNYMTSGGLKATVTVPQLASVASSGSGDLLVINPSGSTFTVTQSGSGDVTLENLSTPSFTANVSGSGDLLAKGKADTLEVNLSGSGSFEGGLTLCQNAHARSTGSGDLKINASSTLNATLSGSGDLTSLGKAQVTLNATGSGKLKR